MILQGPIDDSSFIIHFPLLFFKLLPFRLTILWMPVKGILTLKCSYRLDMIRRITLNFSAHPRDYGSRTWSMLTMMFRVEGIWWKANSSSLNRCRSPRSHRTIDPDKALYPRSRRNWISRRLRPPFWKNGLFSMPITPIWRMKAKTNWASKQVWIPNK